MLDFIFPNVCPFCERVSKDRKVCDSCLSGIRFIGKGSICLKCGVPFDFAETSDRLVPDHFCGECLLGGFYFDKARSVAFYNGLLKETLHRFKYQGKLGLGRALSNILVENLPDDLDRPRIVIPVPLYIARLRKREYNQSVILGENLARFLRVPFNPFVLRRVRDTKPQFEISSEYEKRKNVNGAFSVENHEKIKGESVLLVDDVFTTGSTMDECARVLLDAGAYRVQVVTLMRAVQI
jgi:ComF family protein